MSYTLTGHLKEIGPTITYGNNGFQKREIVIVTSEQYPQTILVEVVKDKCEALDDYTEGEEVILSINLLGREWVDPNGRSVFFNNFRAWRIERPPLSGKTPSEKYIEEQEERAKQVPHDSEFSNYGDQEDSRPF